MGFLLLVVLAILVLGLMPGWNYSRRWGYGPSGLVGLILVVVVVSMLFDVVRWNTLLTGF